MRLRQRFLILGLATTAAPIAIIAAPPALADCVDAGGAVVCAQGTVRGGGPEPPSTGPYVPYPCDYDWYCDGGDLDVILDPDPPRIDIGRPGPPGGGIDIGRPGGGRR